MADLRKCTIKERIAYFHKWSDKSQIIPPSPMVGGHNGGVLMHTVAIIEYEDGVITECYPHEIKFIDKPVESPPVNYAINISNLVMGEEADANRIKIVANSLKELYNLTRLDNISKGRLKDDT